MPGQCWGLVTVEAPKRLLDKVNSWRRGGYCTPLTKAEAKLLLKHNVSVAPNGCWLWKLKLDKFGYGRLPRRFVRAMGSKSERVHVVAYALWKGSPKNPVICHACDTPACCSPKHLWEGTQKENMQDAARKGRWESLRGTNNPFYGRKHTLESRIKMRAMKVGMTQSELGRLASARNAAKGRAAQAARRRQE